jgi:hypothetical protein
MDFANHVRTWRVARLYSEIVAPSRKPFGIGHMYIYTLLLTMSDTMTSQNIDLSSWDTLYILWITTTLLNKLNCITCRIQDDRFVAKKLSSLFGVNIPRILLSLLQVEVSSRHRRTTAGLRALFIKIRNIPISVQRNRSQYNAKGSSCVSALYRIPVFPALSVIMFGVVRVFPHSLQENTGCLL